MLLKYSSVILTVLYHFPKCINFFICYIYILTYRNSNFIPTLLSRSFCITSSKTSYTRAYYHDWLSLEIWLQVVKNISKVFPKDNEAPPGGVDDMTKLSYLHEPGVLHNLATRYELNEIYVRF